MNWICIYDPSDKQLTQIYQQIENLIRHNTKDKWLTWTCARTFWFNVSHHQHESQQHSHDCHWNNKKHQNSANHSFPLSLLCPARFLRSLRSPWSVLSPHIGTDNVVVQRILPLLRQTLHALRVVQLQCAVSTVGCFIVEGDIVNRVNACVASSIKADCASG